MPLTSLLAALIAAVGAYPGSMVVIIGEPYSRASLLAVFEPDSATSRVQASMMPRSLLWTAIMMAVARSAEMRELSSRI